MSTMTLLGGGRVIIEIAVERGGRYDSQVHSGVSENTTEGKGTSAQQEVVEPKKIQCKTTDKEKDLARRKEGKELQKETSRGLGSG